MNRDSRPLPIPAPSTPKGGFRQSERAEIPEAALTARERKVLAVLRAAGQPLTVKQLARQCFPGMRAKTGRYETKRADGSSVRHGTAAAYRCVLNSLRRLVVGSFVTKIDRGTYAAIASATEPPVAAA